MKLPAYDWLWVVWWVAFFILEGIGIWHEIQTHGNDEWTLTHFLATIVPMDARVGILAWLVIHFLVSHQRG